MYNYFFHIDNLEGLLSNTVIVKSNIANNYVIAKIM